jgi:hypothetical protein
MSITDKLREVFTDMGIADRLDEKVMADAEKYANGPAELCDCHLKGIIIHGWDLKGGFIEWEEDGIRKACYGPDHQIHTPCGRVRPQGAYQIVVK